jgi:hypothetical protein
MVENDGTGAMELRSTSRATNFCNVNKTIGGLLAGETSILSPRFKGLLSWQATDASNIEMVHLLTGNPTLPDT